MAINLTNLRLGNHLENSLSQLPKVLFGAMTRKGPLTDYWMRNPIMAIDWIVLPNPISSARIPLIPDSYRDIIQFRPKS